MKQVHIVVMVLCLFVISSGTLNAFHDGDHGEGPTDQIFKVGKTGEVNIGRDVKIASYLVKRGKYLVTHRTEEQGHVFVLTEVNKKKQPLQLVVYELNSRFVAHPDRVKNSTLLAKEQKDHSYEVVRIQMAGENGDHVFAASPGGNNASLSKKN